MVVVIALTPDVRDWCHPNIRYVSRPSVHPQEPVAGHEFVQVTVLSSQYSSTVMCSVLNHMVVTQQHCALTLFDTGCCVSGLAHCALHGMDAAGAQA